MTLIESACTAASGGGRERAFVCTRVAAERRQRTRAQLLESALGVFADKGLDVSIDELIVAAGVSRGTFYNYFNTPAELVTALGDELSRELITLVENTVSSHEDPVHVVGAGVRLFLDVLRQRPQLAAFVWRAGFAAVGAATLLLAYLPLRIAAGIEQDRFKVQSAETGSHVVAGIALAAAWALSTQQVSDTYVEQIVRQSLLALGATVRHADKIAALQSGDVVLPEASLLGRIKSTTKIADRAPRKTSAERGLTRS